MSCLDWIFFAKKKWTTIIEKKKVKEIFITFEYRHVLNQRINELSIGTMIIKKQNVYIYINVDILKQRRKYIGRSDIGIEIFMLYIYINI